MTSHQIFLVTGLVVASLVWVASSRWRASGDSRRANVRLLAALFALTFSLVMLRPGFLALPLWTQLAVAAYAVVGLSLWAARDSFARMFVPASSAQQLGWIRVAVCASLLVLAIKDDLTSTLLMPAEFQRSRPPIGILEQELPNIFALRDLGFLTTLQRFTILTLALGMLGLGTRMTLVAAAACYTLFHFVLVSYSHFYHSGFLPLQILYLLCFLPASHGLSFDAVIRRRLRLAPREASPQTYGYAVFACTAIYGLVYYACGLSKLAVDPLWANAQNVKTIILSDAAHLIDHAFGLNFAIDYVGLGLPDALFGFLGAGAMLTETSGVLLVFRRSWSKLLAPAIVSLHLGIFLFQKFMFVDLLVLPLMFVSAEWLLAKLGLPARATTTIERRRAPYAVAASTAAVVALGAWCFRWDRFPLASHWGMYGLSMMAESIRYSRLTVEYKDGRKEVIDLTREIDFLGHARWLDVVSMPDPRKPQTVKRLQSLLESYARAHDASQPPEKHVARFLIEARQWEFEKEPQNPDGQQVASRIFEMPARVASDGPH